MLGLLAQVPPTEPIETPDVAWSGLMPLIILGAAAIVLLTIMSLAKESMPAWFSSVFTALAGVATIVASIPLWIRVQDVPEAGEFDRGPFATVASAYGVDGFSVFLTMLLGAVVVMVALLANNYLRREDLDGPEFYALVMLSAAGGIVMVSANDLIVMFLGLEVLSLAVYVLAAFHLRRVESQEAGMKYFVLGALSSAIFLYGIALAYGATGSTNLVEINIYISDVVILQDALLLGAFALLLVGFGFKVAAVPFHFWTPDVYEGAPTPVVSFMASAVKVAAFAGLLRVFYVTFGDYRADWQPIVYGLAVATLLVGSLMAIVQTDVKRMLAYSSISHAGYLLVGVQAASGDGTASVLFYLAAYSFMVIGTFAVVMLVSGPGDNRTSLTDFRGLSNARPLLAAALTVFLLGQAGVPFTSGFFAKFYVIGAAVDSRSYGLAIIAMLAAVVAAFLYLRIMVSVWLDAADDEPSADDPSALAAAKAALPIPWGAAVVLTVAVGFTMVFGLWPQPIVEMARDAVPVLTFG